MLTNKGHPLYDLLAAIAGALLPLAFAPINLYFIAVVSPVLAFVSWHGVRPVIAARRGFLFGLGMFGVGVSWVYVAIHVYGFTGAPLAALLTFLFVAFLALFPTLQAYFSVRLQQRLPLILHGLAFAMLWMFFEWLRSWIFTGFPWLNLGYSQINAPLGGYAPVFGSAGVSMLLALTAAVLWQLMKQRTRFSWSMLAIIVLIWLGGWGLKSVAWSQATGKPLKVAVVQGNLPQITKWDPDKIQQRLDRYAALSNPYWGKVDAIVWPENSLTILWQDAPRSYRDKLQQHVRQSGTDLVMGLPYANMKTGDYYSSMLVLGKHPGVYNKRHLVPFGEYVPFASILRGLIKFFNLPMSGFSSGARHQKHLEVAGQPLAPSICYEDAFGSELLDFLPQATLLINGSNNAWYGDSLAPHQHLQISRMRALETSRDLIRATTTGISALVDQHGQIISRTPEFKTEVLVGQVQPRTGATPYVRMASWPVNGMMFVVLGFLIVFSRRYRLA